MAREALTAGDSSCRDSYLLRVLRLMICPKWIIYINPVPQGSDNFVEDTEGKVKELTDRESV